MNPTREGPETIVRSEIVCGECRHLKMRMIRSGHRPIYEYSCNHNEVVKGFMLIPRDGRAIGENDITPSWCPFRK